MKVSRTAIALSSIALVGAAPPPSPDARLRAIVAPVSPAQLRHTIETLVSFGTRHTLSSQTDPKRGIGAALGWTKGQFESFGLAKPVRPCETFTGSRIPNPTPVCDMVAIQRGTERPNDVVIIQGHIDSRVTDLLNFTSDAPGANDDGSGTAAVHRGGARALEAQISRHDRLSQRSRARSRGCTAARCWPITPRRRAGTSSPSSTTTSSATAARRMACATPRTRACCPKGRARRAQTELADATHSLGGENDAPSRNISRYLDSLADRLKIGLDVRQIWRTDRFGRGGDHIPFLELGYPAARISVAVENYDWQHQDLRTENGKRYGDTIDHVDFAYLAKMTKLNVAALAASPAPRRRPSRRSRGR